MSNRFAERRAANRLITPSCEQCDSNAHLLGVLRVERFVYFRCLTCGAVCGVAKPNGVALRRPSRDQERSRLDSRLTHLERALADVIADVRRRVAVVDQSPRDVMEAAIAPVLVAALVADDAGQFVATNAAASALTGYAPDELQHLSVWELTPNVLVDTDAATRWRAFIRIRLPKRRIRLVHQTPARAARR